VNSLNNFDKPGVKELIEWMSLQLVKANRQWFVGAMIGSGVLWRILDFSSHTHSR
jgi:hypothetical protein